MKYNVEVFIVLFILCPVPYVYLYLVLMNVSEVDIIDSNQQYDVYYTLYGKQQEITEEINNCTKCLSFITPETRIIDAECIGNDYKCGVKLALQCIIKAFDYTNNNMDDTISKTKNKDQSDNNDDDYDDKHLTILSINMAPSYCKW